MKQSDQPARRNYERALKVHPWLTSSLIDQRVDRVIQASDTKKVKHRRLVKIIDAVDHALAPYVACQPGCDHCCHIAVTITEAEAADIGRAAHIQPVTLPPITEARSHDLELTIDAYRGVPCPFLVEHQCSIYTVRPTACRGFHNLNDDNGQCKLSVPSHLSRIPSFNLKTPLYALAFLSLRAGESIGDIREYFPTGVPHVPRP